MKRFVKIFIVPFLFVFLAGCQKGTVSEIQVRDLGQTENAFQWPGTEFGSSIQETEKCLNCQFPVIPFNSQEWQEGNGTVSEDQVFDYRSNNDYYYVEYACYRNNQPVTVSYKKSIGYLTCEFNEGQLRCVYCYFGDGPMPHDPKMDFQEKKQDTKAIYQQLISDTTDVFGDPDDSYSLFGNDCYVWNRGDTRLTIAWNNKSSYSTYAMLAINKIVPKKGDQ